MRYFLLAILTSFMSLPALAQMQRASAEPTKLDPKVVLELINNREELVAGRAAYTLPEIEALDRDEKADLLEIAKDSYAKDLQEVRDWLEEWSDAHPQYAQKVIDEKILDEKVTVAQNYIDHLRGRKVFFTHPGHTPELLATALGDSLRHAINPQGKSTILQGDGNRTYVTTELARYYASNFFIAAHSTIRTEPDPDVRSTDPKEAAAKTLAQYNLLTVLNRLRASAGSFLASVTYFPWEWQHNERTKSRVFGTFRTGWEMVKSEKSNTEHVEDINFDLDLQFSFASALDKENGIFFNLDVRGGMSFRNGNLMALINQPPYKPLPYASIVGGATLYRNVRIDFEWATVPKVVRPYNYENWPSVSVSILP